MGSLAGGDALPEMFSSNWHFLGQRQEKRFSRRLACPIVNHRNPPIFALACQPNP